MTLGADFMGDDWERLAHQFLLLRYPDYQRVPADHGGDAGVDGFCASSGCLYQCYGPNPLADMQTRYEDQRDKMTADLNTMEKNLNVIRNWMGGPIRQWTLLVPRHESANLVSAASRKTAQYRSKGLAELAPDFTVTVQDASQYQAEIRQIFGRIMDDLLPGMHLRVDGDGVRPSDTFLQNLNAKAEYIEPQNDQRRARLISNMERLHAARITMLESMQEFETTYERYLTVEAHLSRNLALDMDQGPSSARELVTSLSERAEVTLAESVPRLSGLAAAELGGGLVALWLMDCSLDWDER